MMEATPPDTRPFAVIDIDGVVADVRHRLVHVSHSPKNWRAFFGAAPDDALLPDGATVVAELAMTCEIVWLSGRPEYCRRDTLRWLAQHRLPQGRLVLRTGRDFRPAKVVKVLRLEELARERPVHILIDDDEAVCQAARAAGFAVLQATWMPDEAQRSILDQAQEREGRT